MPGVHDPKSVAIIGGGPAGLIAAERLSAAGAAVTVFDQMPSVGRKFLMAGRGGLNLTHSEKPKVFIPRYGEAAHRLEPMLRAFSPKALRAWSAGLGQPTFTGSSGRVFPETMKASPLLRAWLARLEGQGAAFRTRMRWTGWREDGALLFRDQDGALESFSPAATLLTLGGASWPRLGSDGGWTDILRETGKVEITPLTASNTGACIAWSPAFAERFAGTPLKSAAFNCPGEERVRGEAMITRYGLEGGPIYALSRSLRAQIQMRGSALLDVDLRPDQTYEQVLARLSAPRGGKTLTTFLRQTIRLHPAAINLLLESADNDREALADPARLSARVKAAPLSIARMQGLERAISSAGGVSWASVDKRLMLHGMPSVFVAGEMLDWDAPTGGYLLQACLSSGAWAAKSILKRLDLFVSDSGAPSDEQILQKRFDDLSPTGAGKFPPQD